MPISIENSHIFIYMPEPYGSKYCLQQTVIRTSVYKEGFYCI